MAILIGDKMEKFPRHDNIDDSTIEDDDNYGWDNERTTFSPSQYFLAKIKSGEYSEIMKPILNRVNPEMVDSLYYCFTNFSLIDSSKNAAIRLSKLLGIKTPYIAAFKIPEEKSDKYPIAAFCEHETPYTPKHTIAFYCRDEREHLETPKELFKVVEIITHEMWHAYQHSERADFCKNNEQSYTAEEIETNPVARIAYYKNPIESEAYVFGKLFTIRFADILKGMLRNEYEEAVKKVDKIPEHLKEDDRYSWAVADMEVAGNYLKQTEDYLDNCLIKELDHEDLCSFALDNTIQGECEPIFSEH